MKLVRKTAGACTFELDWIERAQLQEILRQYPLTPLSHHRISRPAAPGQAGGDQQLLEEARAAHQQALRRQVQELLRPGRRFLGAGDKYHLTLQGAEMEGLLQALNDVRVGCWVQLGCPQKLPPATLTQAHAGQYLMMESVLWFEELLLQALDEPGEDAPPGAQADPAP